MGEGQQQTLTEAAAKFVKIISIDLDNGDDGIGDGLLGTADRLLNKRKEAGITTIR
jgi:hypothetical protein